MPEIDVLLALETRVWDALVSGDAAADSALLSSDFLGVYPDGFANRHDHVGQLADGPTVSEYEIESASSMMLTADHAVLSYLATFRRNAGSVQEQMYVTSIWSRRDGAWVNVFSQDTPAVTRNG